MQARRLRAQQLKQMADPNENPPVPPAGLADNPPTTQPKDST
jgi:hypothetical protein